MEIMNRHRLPKKPNIFSQRRMRRKLLIVLILNMVNNHALAGGSCSKISSCLICVGTKCIKCNAGFYGPSCAYECSSGCKSKRCHLDRMGIAQCTDGCKPGWYGSQCKIPCQPPRNSCLKCPQMCQDGFCQLGSRCESGCVDSYYGTSCFTCGPDCLVCNRYTDRCYNCTDGCPFSSCPVQDQCQDRWQATTPSLRDQSRAVTSGPTGNSTHRTVWIAVGFMILILLTGLSVGVFCYRRRHNSTPGVPDISYSINNIATDSKTRIHRKPPLDSQCGGPSDDLYTNMEQQGKLDQKTYSHEDLSESEYTLDDTFECIDPSSNDVYENL